MCLIVRYIILYKRNLLTEKYFVTFHIFQY